MGTLPKLPPRPESAHKGRFGRIQIIGGSAGMAGAPSLAALAALRSGGGLLQVVCPPEIRSAVAVLVPCATIGGLERCTDFAPTVRAVGPGCADQLTSDTLIELLRATGCPLVIDADGLNHLARIEGWWKLLRSDVVLTPHPGEMKRLLSGTELSAARPRPEIAQKLAELCGAVVVLKGHRTVVSSGTQTYTNTTGNPGMATGGSGDVLTGVIAALIGQGLNCYDAACVGVHVHGLAGDLAAQQKGQISLIATDIIEALPGAFRQYQGA